MKGIVLLGAEMLVEKSGIMKLVLRAMWGSVTELYSV